MAQNFRLAYNDGFQYVDLFPQTNIESIEGKDKLLRYTNILVDIPATTDIQQYIPITITSTQATAPFYMELVGSDAQAVSDYGTITQALVTDTELIITRLNDSPKGQIQVKLTFKENEL